jgi:hypothetical protein
MTDVVSLQAARSDRRAARDTGKQDPAGRVATAPVSRKLGGGLCEQSVKQSAMGYGNVGPATIDALTNELPRKRRRECPLHFGKRNEQRLADWRGYLNHEGTLPQLKLHDRTSRERRGDDEQAASPAR